MKKAKEEVARADQVNNNMRAKIMDLELEKESLQVSGICFQLLHPKTSLAGETVVLQMTKGTLQGSFVLVTD